MSVPRVRKTYQDLRRPTPAQERELEAVLWRCRTLYNTALEQRVTAYRRCGVTLSRFDQEAELKDIRAAVPEYASIHSHVLHDMIARLDMSYQTFFRRVQRGEKAGFPRFQGRDRYHRFSFKQYGNGVRLDTGFLVFSKMGRVAVHWSRPLAGTPKTVTISHKADGWYGSFSCADVPTEPLPDTGRETGIDVGLKVFLVTADGAVVENRRPFRKAERQLVHAQRRVSRRKQGGNRRKKAVALLARAHQHVTRQRRDFHHKTALALVRQYDTIHHEASQPANLSRRLLPVPDGNGGYVQNGTSRKAGLNESIQDAGWGHFLNILAFKAACAGKRVAAVNPAYTSQNCSRCGERRCGERVKKSRSVRTHVCPNCDLVIDRDENAARTIQRRGQRLRGVPAMAGATHRDPVGL